MAHIRTLPRTRRTVDTASRLGFQWDRYRDLFAHDEPQFLAWIAPFAADDFAGREVLDAGCGMGRHSLFAARYGAHSVLAVDESSLAVNAAHELCARVPGVRVERRSLYDLSIKRAFDVVLAIGVLHHVEHPRLALEKLCETLRRGGKLVAWLHAHEGNEGWVRGFRRVHPLLRLLPPRALHAFAYLVSTPIYFGLPLRSELLTRASLLPFRALHASVFAQLVPEISRYYRREEVEALFGELDLAKLEIFARAGGWTVIAEK